MNLFVVRIISAQMKDVIKFGYDIDNDLLVTSYPTISTSLEVIVLLLENVFLLCFQGLSMGFGISLLFQKMTTQVIMHRVTNM